MKKFAIVILILTAAVSFFGQTRTVTNEDLEKFRRQRLESERKLKEKYAAIGITPEEIESQNRQKRAAMEQYSDRLRSARIQSQNDLIAQANALRLQIAALDAEINYLRRQYNSSDRQGIIYSYGYAPYGGYTSYGYRGGNRSVLPQLRNLPPNMRTVQEYASMYPSTQSTFNPRVGGIRPGGRIGGYGIRTGSGRNNYYRGGTI